MRISYWSSYVCSSDRFADGAQAVDGAGIWMLPVKPQVLRQVCEPLAPLARAQRPVLVSIAAGTTSAQSSRWHGGGEGPDVPDIVLSMPTTPAMLGSGDIGRAQVRTPVTNSHPVSRTSLVKK